ncbi:Di-/tripeptide transporter [Gluconobacter morbifer G707]|uniref:Di-/tripeptide transporter n=1 Tax=Gluconobacter morbifer G707 TaxID=1088869 RepID=G6XI55_9PROT|nr:Di-/tripeptide transporter [Gluconobacter morbifer G707]
MLTEAWVAFSLYGMQAILVLYLTYSLLTPEHVAHVWGYGALHHFVSFLYAPSGRQATAGAITGLFLAGIYAMPLFGGFLADRVLGQTRTILLGAVLMTAGHILLSFDWSFVIALGLLLLGIGAAGGLRAQVGALYAVDDRRRSDAYQIYMLGIQAAVIVSPLLCGALAQVAWHWGFLAAGLGMLIGLVIYAAGRHWLPSENIAARKVSVPRPALTRTEKKTCALLLFLIPVLAIAALPNEEIFDGYLLWGQQHYALTLLGYPFPVSALLSLDGFISTITAVAVLGFWKVYARYRPDVSEITKVAIGTFIASFSPLLLALGSWITPQPHQLSLLWGIAFHTVNDIGFAMNYAIGMALFSRAAPKSVNTIMVACFSLHLFLANLIVGKFSTLLGHVSDATFWFLHSGAALGASVVLGFCAMIFRPLLAPETSVSAPSQGE